VLSYAKLEVGCGKGTDDISGDQLADFEVRGAGVSGPGKREAGILDWEGSDISGGRSLLEQCGEEVVGNLLLFLPVFSNQKTGLHVIEAAPVIHLNAVLGILFNLPSSLELSVVTPVIKS
jgi:hypothetical protein